MKNISGNANWNDEKIEVSVKTKIKLKPLTHLYDKNNKNLKTIYLNLINEYNKKPDKLLHDSIVYIECALGTLQKYYSN